jgi:hypothetical protein
LLEESKRALLSKLNRGRPCFLPGGEPSDGPPERTAQRSDEEGLRGGFRDDGPDDGTRSASREGWKRNCPCHCARTRSLCQNERLRLQLALTEHISREIGVRDILMQHAVRVEE